MKAQTAARNCRMQEVPQKRHNVQFLLAAFIYLKIDIRQSIVTNLSHLENIPRRFADERLYFLRSSQKYRKPAHSSAETFGRFLSDFFHEHFKNSARGGTEPLLFCESGCGFFGTRSDFFALNV